MKGKIENDEAVIQGLNYLTIVCDIKGLCAMKFHGLWHFQDFPAIWFDVWDETYMALERFYTCQPVYMFYMQQAAWSK